MSFGKYKIHVKIKDKQIRKKENRMHYTYMLKCRDNTYYTGYTTNLEKRLKAHNEGKGAKYTKGRGPVELVYYEEHEDKQTAMRREWEIKQLRRSEKEFIQTVWKENRADNGGIIDDKQSLKSRFQGGNQDE